MKKIYLSIVFITASICTINGQSVPNSGFEIWSQNGPFETPNNWNVSPAASKSTDTHSGSYALQLKTGVFTNPQTQSTDTIPGMAATGQQVMGPGNQGNNGFSYTARPDSLVFWYKYQDQNNDSFAVRLNLTKWNTNVKEVISDLVYKGGSTSKYTRVALAVPYFTNSTPDSATILAISSLSPRENLILGSTLILDDISFKNNIISINESVANENIKISLFPNPCSDVITIANFTSEMFKLIDVYGSVIAEQNTMGLNQIELTTASLASGIYFVVLNNGVYHKIIKE
jgi:hypothetical protein